jgi:hypothetical protein
MRDELVWRDSLDDLALHRSKSNCHIGSEPEKV